MSDHRKKPSHPGLIIRAHHLDPLGLNVTEFARRLAVSRKTASKIINGRGAITPEMALRLARAFNTSPEHWLGLQLEYDLWRARRESKDWMEARPATSAARSTHALTEK